MPPISTSLLPGCYGTSLSDTLAREVDVEQLRQTIQSEIRRALQEVAPGVEPGMILDILVDAHVAHAQQIQVEVSMHSVASSMGNWVAPSSNEPNATWPDISPSALDLSQDYQQIERAIFAGLGLTQQELTEGPTIPLPQDDRVDALYQGLDWGRGRDQTAYFVSSDATNPARRIEARRVTVPTFELSENPTFHLSEVVISDLYGDRVNPLVPSQHPIIVAVLRKKRREVGPAEREGIMSDGTSPQIERWGVWCIDEARWVRTSLEDRNAAQDTADDLNYASSLHSYEPRRLPDETARMTGPSRSTHARMSHWERIRANYRLFT